MVEVTGSSEAERKALKKSLRTNFDPGPRDYANRALLLARRAAHTPGWLLGHRPKRPVFIIGSPRSGTSMLFSILRASGELSHWPGEAHEVWEADYHPALRGWESNVLGPEDVEPAAAERISRAFFGVTGARKALIDKTPRNALRVGFVDALFPNARYVFLKRDGRDNVNSLINAWRTPRFKTYKLPRPHAIPGIDPQWWKFVLYPGWEDDRQGPIEQVSARQWIASNEYALDSASGIDEGRWIEVSYEELSGNPVAAVGRVLALLELEYDKSVRSKAEAAIHTPVNVVTPPERGKWRRENPHEIERIEKLIQPTMTRLGYGDAH